MNTKQKKQLKRYINSICDPRVGFIRAGDAIVGGVGGGLGALVVQFSIPLGVVFLLIFITVLYIGHNIRKHTVVDNNYFMCPWCGGDLGRIEAKDVGHCTKCQSRYVKQSCVNLYKSKFSWFWFKNKRTRLREKYLWARAFREKLRDQES